MFVQAPFQPSLRDLWSILLLVPGLKLKAWAIFESPFGTNEKSDSEPSWLQQVLAPSGL